MSLSNSKFIHALLLSPRGRLRHSLVPFFCLFGSFLMTHLDYSFISRRAQRRKWIATTRYINAIFKALTHDYQTHAREQRHRSAYYIGPSKLTTSVHRYSRPAQNPRILKASTKPEQPPNMISPAESLLFVENRTARPIQQARTLSRQTTA